MLKHTLTEWNIILAAYVYECTEETAHVMSDQAYDKTSKELKGKTTIPYFNPNTGQWIHKLIKKKQYKPIIKNGYNRWKRYLEREKQDGIIMHLIFPSEVIEETYSYPEFEEYKLFLKELLTNS